jgi:transposase-like protein
MKRIRHSPEQIINKLREADAMLASGKTVAQVIQHLAVSEQTYHRWRNQFGGMKSEEAKRLKELEIENARLKRVVANQAIDISILREANDYLGKPQAPHGGGRL